MPLPSVTQFGAARCRAITKSAGIGCGNPAAYGMKVCRMHGARRPETVLRGVAHPAYKHGQETLEIKAGRSAALARIRALGELLHSFNMIKAKRKPGRKPQGRQG